MSSENISSVLDENRVFEPSEEFSKNAYVGSIADARSIKEKADADPLAFWEEQAK